MNRMLASAVALTIVPALLAPAFAAETKTYEVTLTDEAFDPAEIHVAADEAFILKVRNTSAAAAEIESNELRFEKIVAPGAEIVIRVRGAKAGTYDFVNEFKEDDVRGKIIAE